MTIAEKSTELGIDLAQIALDTYGVAKRTEDGTYHCFCTKGGIAQNVYILDDNGDKVHDGYFRWADGTLAEGSTLTAVEDAFKAYIDAQELNPVSTVVVTVEDIA